MANAVSEREFNYCAADFENVRRILYQKAGINLSDSKKQLVYSRLARRLRLLKLSTFADYLDYLNAHEHEQEEFINALTTNLTAFFREPHHFDILAHHAEKVWAQKRKLRIWCAASSTGEEPYSIAMCLVNTYGDYNPPVEIIASDIDSKVLQEAGAGIYSLNRLDTVSDEFKKNFFQRGTGHNSGYARIIPDLKKLIHFQKLNLLEKNWSIKADFDVIFCRNVMIYFDKETQFTLLERMLKLLRNDGLYIAGHSESFSQAGHIIKLVGKTTYAFTSTAGGR